MRPIQLYKEPKVYDLAYSGPRGDATFYSRISSHRKTLYLGVGSGRIFLKMDRKNSQICGVDCSVNMLRKLKKKISNTSNSSLIIWNVLNSPKIFSGEKFDQIIAPFSFFAQFEEGDVKKILKNCQSLLNEGGRIVTDFFNPALNPKEDYAKFEKVKSGFKITKHEFYDHKKNYLLEITCVKKDKKQMIGELALKCYFPNKIRKIFSVAGFKPKLYGGYSRQSLTKRSKNIILIAEKLNK